MLNPRFIIPHTQYKKLDKKGRCKTKLSEIKILPRFRDKIPPQTEEQFKQLEENILTEGRVREPLTLWKGHNVLIDGHHRKRVLDEHPEIPFTIDEIELADEDAVDEWIIKNQLGKHNLTPPQISTLRALLYRQEKRKVGAPIGNDNASKNNYAENAELISKRDIKDGVAGKVGKQFGVSARTIHTDVEVLNGIERAEKVDPTFRTEVLTGQLKASKAELSQIGKASSDEEVKAAISEIRNPTVSKVTSRTSGSKDNRLFNEKLNAIGAEMEKPKGNYTLDDALRDLNSAEDVFINQIEFIIRARKPVIEADERCHEAWQGFIESVINDLEEMKGRF